MKTSTNDVRIASAVRLAVTATMKLDGKVKI
jgi:hypothetical protein